MSHTVRCQLVVSAASALLLFSAFKPGNAYAACTVSGLTTSCDATAPNPSTTTIGTGPSTPSGSIVTLTPNAQVVLGNATAISLGDNANITVRSGALVQNASTNSNGLYSTGGNTVEFRNNSTLTVEQGAQVVSAGTQGSAEAVNPQGSGNAIINSGTIRGFNSAAIWFQNTSGQNTVINNETGIIQAPGSVIGASGNGSVDFSNKGQVRGNLVFAGGDDTLRLYTGSIITGNFNGGGGNNTIFLSGTGNTSLPGNIVNFATLYKNDPGVWTLTGTITGVTLAQVQQGTLVLTGNNSQYTGKVIVDRAGTLEARAQSLPPSVTDNGLVRFAQPDDGTFTGLISGTGAVEKTQAGTLVMAPNAPGGNTYSGGTMLTAGVVIVSADSALGAATGGLTFNGGSLQLQQNFDLAQSRAVTLNSPGGTIDTQGFSSTLAQGMTGPGAFTKAGMGRLTLTGANTYAGGTTISAGTLQLGNGGANGSIVGDVVNNSSLVFNRADNVIFPGVISGSGTVTQAGTGSTVLTAINTYSGTTAVTNGTLAVGDVSHQKAMLSGGGSTSVSPGATLGGYGSVFGKVTNNGTLAVADGLAQFAGSGSGAFTINGQLINAGLLQVGGLGVGNRLNIVGNYVGQNGVVSLNTYVAGDGSPSDRLVVDGGTAQGSSALRVRNIGGAGALTLRDGIQVVQAINGAVTEATAFTLAGPVKSGAYSYYLAKGGVTGGTAQNWYLRNAVPPVSLVPDSIDFPVPSASTLPLPSPQSTPTPLYRPEVPIYAEVPAIARQISIEQLDNFHDRQGDQSLLAGDGKWPAAWGRVWGGRTTQGQDGTVNPGYKGSIDGLQTGVDVYADANGSGHRNHYGLFIGHARTSGDVDGFAMGLQRLAVGRLAIDAYSLGGYWTHIGPGGWYADAVLMGSSLSIDTNSRDGLGTSVHGKSFSGSIEGGRPFALSENLTLEPQAQLIWQKVSVNDLNDTVSAVTFNTGNTFLGRVGVRLQSRFESLGIVWQPYARLNLLRNFGSSDNVVFGGATAITTSVSQTAAQINAGIVAKISKSTSAFVTAAYTANLGGKRQRTVMGNAGMRWTW